MKISQLSNAEQLVRDIRRFRSMQEVTTGFPRRTGYLDLNDKSFALPHATVDAILEAEWARIEAVAAELGIEVDE